MLYLALPEELLKLKSEWLVILLRRSAAGTSDSGVIFEGMIQQSIDEALKVDLSILGGNSEGRSWLGFNVGSQWSF